MGSKAVSLATVSVASERTVEALPVTMATEAATVARVDLEVG